MQITAAVLRDRTGRYEIEDVTLADPGPGQIVVRIVGVGHCHTDLLARGAHSTSALPLVVGHEGSGVVETVGANTDGIAVGDHVVLSYDSCRRCVNCQSGHPAYCDSFVRRNFGDARARVPAVMHDKHGLPVFARWFGQSSFATHALVAAQAGQRARFVGNRRIEGIERLRPLRGLLIAQALLIFTQRFARIGGAGHHRAGQDDKKDVTHA